MTIWGYPELTNGRDEGMINNESRGFLETCIMILDNIPLIQAYRKDTVKPRTNGRCFLARSTLALHSRNRVCFIVPTRKRQRNSLKNITMDGLKLECKFDFSLIKCSSIALNAIIARVKLFIF
jgi:hypothetical protein